MRLLVALLLCSALPALAAKDVHCKATCNIQVIRKGAPCPERVFGTGSAPAQDKACLAAQKDANRSVPQGCYKRHCDCKCK